ncbi:hypothetical protein EAO71_26400, partial [Streptomyces sp. ms191]
AWRNTLLFTVLALVFGFAVPFVVVRRVWVRAALGGGGGPAEGGGTGRPPPVSGHPLARTWLTCVSAVERSLAMSASLLVRIPDITLSRTL